MGCFWQNKQRVAALFGASAWPALFGSLIGEIAVVGRDCLAAGIRSTDGAVAVAAATEHRRGMEGYP